MIKLNPLPPQEKNNLKLEQIQRWIFFYGGAVSILLFIFVFLLIFTWLFISAQIKSYSLSLENTKTSSQGQSVNEQLQLINDLNLRLEKINTVQKNHKYFSSVMTELGSLVPSGIRLEGLSIDENSQGTLSGYAQKREQVILFKENLEKSNSFEKIESPLSNLTKQVDLNFSFKFSLRANALKK